MITIYGKKNCVWCDRAKALADTKNIQYTYLSIDETGVYDQLKTKLPDVRSVPQIWEDERHIGGYEAFAIEVKSGRIQASQ